MMADEKTNLKEPKDDILKEARHRFEIACDADREERGAALDDLNFLNGDQWPENIKTEREKPDSQRPCLTINRLPMFHDQVVGDQRQNRPGIKIKPHDGDSDPKTAAKLEGLIRNIEVTSDANTVYMTGFESSTACGRGFFRILTDYADDNSFDQEISLGRIGNPFTVYWDSSAEDINLIDANWMFVSGKISKEQFERDYPDAALSDFETAIGDLSQWVDEHNVRIAEYWRKQKVGTQTIYQLENGEVVSELPKGVKPVKTRVVDIITIEWMKITGTEILEGPKVWPGKYFPIVPIWGKEINIEGERKLRGIVRFAKDPQRMYNYWRTTTTEVVALAPKNPYLATEKQIAGHESMWNNINRGATTYVLYNPDAQAPGPPKRETPATIPTGLANEAEFAAREMMDTIGIHEAGLGEKSNEKSGEAIKQRRAGGDRGNYAYSDNLARALVHAGRIILDLIPKIYDGARVVRILGVDGTEEFATLNSDTDLRSGDTLKEVINMDEIGKYDVAVTVGPSYTTKRMEDADSIMEFMRVYPEAAPFIADLAVQGLDWQSSDEIVERLRAMLPPEIKAVIDQGTTNYEEDEGELPEAEMLEQAGQEAPPESEPGQEPGQEPLAEIKVSQEQAKLEGIVLDNSIKEAQLEKAVKEADLVGENDG